MPGYRARFSTIAICVSMWLTYVPITMTNVILTVLILARGITPKDRTLRILDSINRRSWLDWSRTRHLILTIQDWLTIVCRRWTFRCQKLSEFRSFSSLNSCSIFVLIERTFLPNNHDDDNVRDSHNNQWYKIQGDEKEIDICLNTRNTDKNKKIRVRFDDWHSNFPHRIDCHRSAYLGSSQCLENTAELKHMTWRWPKRL